jgi:hypothetical protein
MRAPPISRSFGRLVLGMQCRRAVRPFVLGQKILRRRRTAEAISWPRLLTLSRDDGDGHGRAPKGSMGFFAPPLIPGVLARCEIPLARQGPSQHPRECEKSGLATQQLLVDFSRIVGRSPIPLAELFDKRPAGHASSTARARQSTSGLTQINHLHHFRITRRGQATLFRKSSGRNCLRCPSRPYARISGSTRGGSG